jgi:hypothetical protein
MAKETANMVAIRIIYRKHVIKAGASDLRNCMHCAKLYSISSHTLITAAISFVLYFYSILAFLLKHTFSEREGYRESGLV